MKVTIQRVENGFIVSGEDEEETTVHGGDEVSLNNALVEVLYRVKEEFEMSPSRYSEERIYIISHYGDKHTDYDPDLDKFR